LPNEQFGNTRVIPFLFMSNSSSYSDFIHVSLQ
jgi:hypothetical protein